MVNKVAGLGTYDIFTEAGKETKVSLKLFSGTNLLSAPLSSLEFREVKLFT